jgi:signal-transduction protein with cAMP-binding, CBS, and nucleotidyltransferase domain
MRDFHVSMLAVFSQIVREHMREAPPTVQSNMTSGEALRIMREFSASSVIIATADGRPIGILTEQDVVRRIAFLNPASTPVAEVMTSPLKIILKEDYLFRGIAIMQKFGLHHLPVVDLSGHLTGMLSLDDALTCTSAHITDLIRRLMHDETPEGLKLLIEAEAGVADSLLKDRIPAIEIQTLLTQINNDIYRQVQALILKELAEQGWGEPPVEFSMMVMGSGGRGENFLFPDQDNGFILTDYPDRQHATVDSFFIELADRMCLMLDTVGIHSCRGYVMAVNPTWRKTLSQWYSQVDNWLERPNHITLRFVDIFFDFQHICGREDLATQLRKHVTGASMQNHVFLREMQLVQQEHGVALGKFGKLTLQQESPYKGKIDLKYRGLLPLVEAVRLLALREGMNETTTLGRIEELHVSGILGNDEKDSLSNAFHNLTTLILRQQIKDFNDKLQVSGYVSPGSLSASEKDDLIDSLRAINELRGRVHAEFTGDVF